jgi:chromosomal replication initiator protein
VRTLAAHDERRASTHGAPGPHRAVDATGDDAAGLCEEAIRLSTHATTPSPGYTLSHRVAIHLIGARDIAYNRPLKHRLRGTSSDVTQAQRSAPNAGLDRLWHDVLAHLLVQTTEHTAREILRRLRLRAVSPAQVVVEAPNRLVFVCVNDHYLGKLKDAVTAVMGTRQVVLEIAHREQGELFPSLVQKRPERRPVAVGSALNPRYTFATFVVGASNQFANAAARAVALQPGDHYNPLFIYGGVGLGKTHLVTAIAHTLLDQDPTRRIAYLSADAFMSDLISSLRRNRMEGFKDRFRDVHTLILDDVQLLAGRERTQEEFFHTFNALYEQRRQIVLTSDQVPKDIPELEERLRNRFEWGLIADIQPPDVETRVAILQRKAEIETIVLPHPVALFLAEHVASNVRELEGVLTRLGAHASLSGQPITVDYARDVLRTTVRPVRPQVTFDAIVVAVCDRFALRPSDLRSRRRSKHVAQPRQLAMYLCRRLLKASLPHIGELFGRDHTTVLHAVTTTERRLKDDLGLQDVVAGLERDLQTSANA